MSDLQNYQFDKITKFIDYRGKTPNKTESGIPLITAKNIKFGFLSEEPKEFIAEEDYDGWMVRGIPNKGDVLFTTEAPLGNVCLLDTNDKRAFAQRAIIFQPLDDETYISQYLFYYLMSPIFIDELDSKKTGTTVKGIKSSILKKFKIPLPPLTEQQRIVKKLDKLFEKIDKSIALHQKNMDEADVFMGSVLNDVFGELEEKYNKKTIDSMSKVGTGVTPLKSRKDFYDNGNVNWITSEATNNDYVYESKQLITNIALNECRLKINPIGTIIIALYGQGKTRGQVSELMIESTTNQALATIIVDSDLLYNKYLKYFLKKSYLDLREKASGGTQPNLNLAIIKNTELPLPPLHIQQKVVTYLDNLSEKIETVKSIQKEKMDTLKALKASILDKVFKGEL